MKLQSLVPSVLVLGAAAISQATAAQAIDRSVPLATAGDGVGGFNAHFGDTFAASTAGGTFSDVFTFRVGRPFDAAASVTSSYLNTLQAKDLRITGLSLYRYDPATMAILGAAIAGIDETGFGPNPTDSWALSAFGLGSGAYALKVNGQVMGAGGGAFGGDLTIAPVPEPQAWAMLLAGLGLVGVALRRKPALRRT